MPNLENIVQEPTTNFSDSSYEVTNPAFQPRSKSPSNFDSTDSSQHSKASTPSLGSPHPIPEDLTSSINHSTTSLSNMNFNFGSRTPDMLPLLGSKTAPRKFKGNFKKVKDFLDKYERMCNVYHVTDPDKCTRLKDYCSYKVVQLIESVASYQTQDWTTLKGILLDYYDADLKETRYSIGHIRKFVVKWRRHTIASLKTWK